MNTPDSVSGCQIDELSNLLSRQSDFFDSGLTLSAEYRRNALRRLQAVLEIQEKNLLEALWADLHKHAEEAFASEIGLVHAEIRHALRHLHRWMKPRRVRTPVLGWPGRSRVIPEPYGRALILGAWNYPVHLLLTPCVNAVAAGNCCVLKPSELAPHTSSVLATVVKEAFAPEHVSLIEGDAEVSRQLLERRHNKIFFTGSTSVGRKVMAQAAEHLTPVTLELGGKCPCIVTGTAAVRTSARRIAWGKFINAGQTCLAPDYVLVDASVRDELVEELKTAIAAFYGSDPRQSPHYGRIINDRHFLRLSGLLDAGRVVCGGQRERQERYIAPTLILDPSPDSALMAEEIFGPVLPVIAVAGLDEALTFVKSRPTPLAAYLFSESSAEHTRMLAESRSGGVCINDTVLHAAGHHLPFGGLGDSGMGSYRGRAGFEAFSHQRAVMERSTWFNEAIRCPPPRLSLAKLKQVWKYLV